MADRTDTIEMSAYHEPAESILSDGGPQTGLRPDLKERHVNMIGFSMVLGIGLFLSAGKVLYMAGPLLAIIAYLLVGTLMWSTLASMGEMTALFPVKGPTFEFVRRFMDDSVGYACAWMLWISCVIVAAAEILAVTELFRFHVDKSYLDNYATYGTGTSALRYPDNAVEWSTRSVDPAVWVFVFLLIEIGVNLLPVRFYGRIEYVFGSVKIMFLVAVIMINIILYGRNQFHSGEKLPWTWNNPYDYKSANFTVKEDNQGSSITWDGSLATFTSLWTAMGTAFFSLMGFDIILLTAPENKDLTKNETIKLSSRKLALRVLLLYSLSVLVVGLNVPYLDYGPNSPLNDITLHGVGGGQYSVFILAAIREHVKFLPHFMNGFFIFSATTTGINCLYASSRILHAIASLHDAWPRWGWVEAIRCRLELTKWGVPMNAVFASWMVAFIAFMARPGEGEQGTRRASSSETLGRMTTVAATCTMIVYALNCFTFLLFYNELEQVVAGNRDIELNIPPGREAAIRNRYKRKNNKSYPYYSHLQWLRALYGLVFSVLLILFGGWRSFISPFSPGDFVASYIAIGIFFVLTATYFFRTRGFNPKKWQIWAQRFEGLEAIGPLVVKDAENRRGKIQWPKGKGQYDVKTKAILDWIWVWLK